METTALPSTELIRPQLIEVEAAMRQNPGEPHPSLDAAVEQLLASGGKRIRPSVTLLAGAMLQGPTDRLITLAAAIEMLHTATLVHDDLIDGAVLRRGVPTLNTRLSAGATVLTGDYVFARAAHMAANTGSLSVMEAFARSLMTIVNGEISQLTRGPSMPSREEYFKRIYAKTASLFELAAEGAALLSNSEADVVEALHTYGYNTGIAFQIVDDVLDFVGNTTEVGKPVGNDLRHGLATLPTIEYLREAPESEPTLALALTGSLPAKELDALIHDIASSPSIGRSLAEAKGFAARAVDSIQGMPSHPARTGLLELADYAVERSL
jgi:geranylgeranyl pyrophosphate synthase